MERLPRIGYFYSYLPKEILYALGRVPVRILPASASAAETEPYLHKNFCALAKVTLAQFLETDAQAEIDLEGVIFGDVCDAQRRLYDVWSRSIHVPVFAFLDLPRRKDALGIAFFAAALGKLIGQLETQLNQPLSTAALADAIRVYDEQRQIWFELTSAWAQGRVPTGEYYALRDLRLQGDPLQANHRLSEAVEQAARTSPRVLKGPRMLLMGSLNVHRGLVRAIGERGAQVVAEDSACGDRDDGAWQVGTTATLAKTSATRAELVGSLASHYLPSPAPRLRDLPRRLDYLKRLAQTRQASAVICSYYKFCDPFLSEFPMVRRFWEEQGLPVLLLEDEGEPDLSGQARTCLEAFLEMASG